MGMTSLVGQVTCFPWWGANACNVNSDKSTTPRRFVRNTPTSRPVHGTHMPTSLRYQFNAQTHFSPTAAGHEPHAAVCDKPAFQGFRVV
jgi:hypothetical protein